MPWDIQTKITLLIVTVLFFFTFFNLILDTPHTWWLAQRCTPQDEDRRWLAHLHTLADFLVSTIPKKFSKYIFPEMKLRGLILNFYILGLSLGAIYIFPLSVLFGISIFLYCMRDPGTERRAGNCRQAVVRSNSLPSPLLLRLSREFT